MAERSKAWVCRRSPSGLVSSNPVGCIGVSLLCLWCVVGVEFTASGRSLAHGTLPSAVSLIVIMNPRQRRGLVSRGLLPHGGKMNTSSELQA